MIKEKLFKVPTEGGEYIALWKIFSMKNDASKNIFLNHGTYSDRKICQSIAEYFAENGYNCWIMEWRNHGSSSKSEALLSFEIIGKRDFPIVFEYLHNKLNINKLDSVTHSGGGLCLTIFLLTHPEYLSKINRAVMFGSQAAGIGYNFKNRFKIRVGKIMSSLMGYSPGKLVGSPHNESHFFMKQWYEWNLSGEFLGEDGRDFEKEMKKIQVPILSICGGGDDFIAPKLACEKFLNAFQNPNNKLLFCATSNGFKENYNHSRILQSRNSRAEIWPLALKWIEGNSI